MREALVLLSLASWLTEQGWAQLGSKLSLRLEESSFEESCFRSGCGGPQLQILLRGADAERSIRWRIDPARLALAVVAQPWHSILTTADSRNLSFSAHITGVDATYNFPRVCDSTAEQPLPPFSLRLPNSLPPPPLQYYALSGLCFNATLSIVRIGCCPDCELDESCCQRPPLLQDPPPEGRVSSGSGGGLEGAVPAWLALVLGLGCVLLFVACVLLLSALFGRAKRKGRKKYSSTAVPRRPHSSLQRSASQESKYDVPWDQKFRPLPDYVRQLNRANPASPAHSTDALHD